MNSETRTLVLMRKDVAPSHWRQSFDALVALAEGGADGLRLMEQNKTGKQERYWDLNVPIPADWAAYYRGEQDSAELHIQNYSMRPKA